VHIEEEEMEEVYQALEKLLCKKLEELGHDKMSECVEELDKELAYWINKYLDGWGSYYL